MKHLFFAPLLLVLVNFGANLSAQSIDLPVTNKLVSHNILFQGSNELIVNLKGLVVGDTYHIHLVQDEYNPPVALSSLPRGLTQQTHTYLQGTVGAGVISFCLDALAPKLTGISIVIGKNLSPTLLNPWEKLSGDTIEVEENNEIDFLLNTVFRKDTCFALFPGNIQGGRRIRADGTFLGQTGIFRNGLATVGIDSGIIITTGWVQDALGPNTPSASQNGPVDFFTTMNGLDPDADSLVPPGVDIYDLAILEFDFIPTTDTISFDYVFFSEQYCATLDGSVANDAFGFMLTGPDGVTVNIARLPISGDIVSPATLNPGTVDAPFFVNNTTPAFGDPCVDTPPPPARLAGIGYDGFSTVLTAHGAVTPCARHTLKIIVLDANDALSDSGVLLEAGSFLAGLVNKPEPSTTAQVDVLQPVEGCDTATIKFTRRTIDEPFINRPLLIKYNIIPFFGGGATEATRTEDAGNTAGADYLLPASPFVIPSGDTSAVLRIPILADADFGEGLEAFIIRYDGTCDCTENADTFWIQDAVNYTVDLGPDQTLCAGNDIILTATPSVGSRNYTYSWPNLADTNRVTYSTTGRDTTIVVSVTDDCGLMGTGMVNIFAPDFSATTVGDYSLCSDPTADVPIDVTGTGPFIISLWVDSNNVVTTTDYQVTGDTTFIFEVDADVTVSAITDLSGCGGAISLDTARIRSADVQFTDIVELALCNAPVGSITVNTADGNANFTFAWLDDAGETTGSRTMLLPGIYEVSIAPVSDPSCARVVRYDLSAPATLEIDTFNYTVPTCAGETITLAPIVVGGTGAYTFSWPDSMTTDSLLTIVTQTGLNVYPVIVTDACGDMVTAFVSYTFEDVRASLGGTYGVCNAPFFADVSVTFTGSTGYTFTLRENGNDRTLVATGDTTLRYTAATTIELLEVRGADGCTGIAGGIATVTDEDFNVTTMVTQVLCQGQATGAISVVVNGNNAAYTFAWDTPGLSGPDVSGLRAGTYNLIVTDSSPFACTWDTTFSVLEPASAITLRRDSIRDQTCSFSGYAAAVYSGGTGQLSYRWSNGNVTDELGEVDPGLYTLSVTDDNMCLVTQAFNIQDLRTVIFATISASADSLNCNLTSINLSAQQNIFAVGYQWQGASGNDLGTNRQLVVTMPGQYFVRVTNPANGCTSIDSITIGLSGDLLDLELPIQYDINCMTTTVDLIVTHAGYTDPVDYAWRLNGTVIGTLATLPNVSVTGTYEVSVTRRDNGCPTVARTEVVINRDDPIVSVPVPSVSSTCRSPEVTIGVVVAGGPYRFDWSTTNGTLVGATNAAITMAGAAGTYSLLVTDTLNGCTTTETIVVVVDGSMLTLNAGTDQSLICNGRGTVLNGSVSPRLNGTEVRWYGPRGNEIGERLQVFTLEEGQHILEVIHPVSGCSSFDTVQVFSEAATSVSYSLQQPPCPEVGGRLFVTEVVGLNGPFTYSSPTGETDPFGNSLRGLRVGTNILIVTDQFGCELRDTFQIFEGLEFTGTAEDVVIRFGEEAVLGINTNRTDGELANWVWGNINDSLTCLTCPNPVVASPLETFIATVTVRDTNGCVLTMRQNVIVDEKDLIYMPSAFSPANVDGVNDVYIVYGNTEFVANVNFLHIFDRWGNQVFRNEDFPVNDPNEGWTGIAPDGGYAPSAVYVYVVSYKRWDGATEMRSGEFTLVR